MDQFSRSKRNPILTPATAGWWKTYNPGAAIDRFGNVHLFPRVVRREPDWHSSIAHAVSTDGEAFRWIDGVALSRAEANETRGLEDPRISLIGDTYYMVYGVYDGSDVCLHTACTSDLALPWERRGPAVPDFRFAAAGGARVRWEGGKPIESTDRQSDKCWSKSGAMFALPDGRYGMLFGEYKIWLGLSADGRRFDVVSRPVIEARRGSSFFDNTFVEMGPPPILTHLGWLALYHGVDELQRYRVGFALLSQADPHRVIYRSSEPIFEAKEPYETDNALVDVAEGGIERLRHIGDDDPSALFPHSRAHRSVPQVVFCTGAILRGDVLWLYYGAADTTVCTAHASLSQILALVG